MFSTALGATGTTKGFMRPETAQAQILNFKRLYEYNHERMPFASACIGKAFRNEISPRGGLLRSREFLMAEIEHFVDPENKHHQRFEEVKHIVLPLVPKTRSTDERPLEMTLEEALKRRVLPHTTMAYYLARTHLFLKRVGLDMSLVRYRQHHDAERAHYALDCWDAEIYFRSTDDWVECVGCADRGDYDLNKHFEFSGEKMVARKTLDEPETLTKLVCEPNKKKLGQMLKKELRSLELALSRLPEIEIAKLDREMKEHDSVEFSFESSESDPLKLELTVDLLKINQVTERVHVKEYIPHVIEPSFGISRLLMAVMDHSWYTRQNTTEGHRNVLDFPVNLAPVKCLVAPLSNHPTFRQLVGRVARELQNRGIFNNVDESSTSIGKRYARNDEMGVPFSVTVDFLSVQDGTVTLRERDSMQQVRIPAEQVADVLERLCSKSVEWKHLLEAFPLYTFETRE